MYRDKMPSHESPRAARERRKRRRPRARDDRDASRTSRTRRRDRDEDADARRGAVDERVAHQSSRCALTVRLARDETFIAGAATNAAREPANAERAPRTADTAVRDVVVRAAIFVEGGVRCVCGNASSPAGIARRLRSRRRFLSTLPPRSHWSEPFFRDFVVESTASSFQRARSPAIFHPRAPIKFLLVCSNVMSLHS